ncbi:MAG: arginine deiminase family protein, partial [Nanoarchaeota archaeon]
LFPPGALYVGSFDPYEAQRQHEAFTRRLQQELPATTIKDVTDVILENATGQLLDNLRALAAERIPTYKNEAQPDLENCLNISRYCALELASPQTLIQHILQSYAITAQQNKDDKNTGVKQQTKTTPLGNLVFLRDQQITTDKGVVVGNMNSLQREPETHFMKLVYQALGFTPIYEVSAQERLEGGDFIPAGDIAFQGVGLRTKFGAVKELLEQGCYGYNEVAVVIDRQPDRSEPEMSEMHLDTFFNVSSRGKCVVLTDRVEEGNPKECYVVVFTKNSEGMYRVAHKNDLFAGRTVQQREYEHGQEKYPMFPFREYLRAKDVKIIGLSKQEQKAFAPNFLTIGEDKVIVVDIAAKEEMRDFFKRFDDKFSKKFGPQKFFDTTIDYTRLGAEYMNKLSKDNIHVIPVRFNHLNMLYGGPHCYTQIFRGMR